MAAPLQLEYHGKAAATGHWRRGQELIDSLPYIDPLTPDVKATVDGLIEEEMRSSTKRPADYLKELPPLPPARFEGHPLLQREYERVRALQPMPALDVTRYRLDPPPQSKRNDHAAWVAAVNNAHAQLEHQLNRILNLELLLKFGPNAWRGQTQSDEALLKQLEATLAGLRKSIDSLNRERKLQQSAAGNELRVLEDQYYSALRKNLEISAACQGVQDEIGLLEARLGLGGAKADGGEGAAAGEAQQEQQQEQANGV